MVKRGEDAAGQFEQGDRPELAAKEREEILIVRAYLPAQMEDGEIRQAAEAAIAELGVSSLKEMGKAMGVLSKQLAGKATGQRISQIVKEILGG